MAKQNIQTILLGTSVKINDGPVNVRWSEHIGSFGIIASVYLDKDGNPKYTIRLNKGVLLNMYSCDFIL